MALRDDEKEYLTLVIKTSINEAMKPVMDTLADNNLSIAKLDQTVYGINRDNGLTGDMKAMKKKISTVNLKLAYASGFVAALALVLKYLL